MLTLMPYTRKRRAEGQFQLRKLKAVLYAFSEREFSYKMEVSKEGCSEPDNSVQCAPWPKLMLIAMGYP